MNTYASWWDDTITLYNKYIEPGTNKVKWYRHVIKDCFYKHVLEKMTVGKTTIDTNTTVCRIRVSDDFIDKKSWMALDDSERAEKFTLSAGDIIVADEIDTEVDEYVQCKRSSDLIKANQEWPGCFTIEIVNINVGGGRGNEHYHVRGV
jgi:hypothetical protein